VDPADMSRRSSASSVSAAQSFKTIEADTNGTSARTELLS
jgi:hypothetical protein